MTSEGVQLYLWCELSDEIGGLLRTVQCGFSASKKKIAVFFTINTNVYVNMSGPTLTQAEMSRGPDSLSRPQEDNRAHQSTTLQHFPGTSPGKCFQSFH